MSDREKDLEAADWHAHRAREWIKKKVPHPRYSDYHERAARALRYIAERGYISNEE